MRLCAMGRLLLNPGASRKARACLPVARRAVSLGILMIQTNLRRGWDEPAADSAVTRHIDPDVPAHFLPDALCRNLYGVQKIAPGPAIFVCACLTSEIRNVRRVNATEMAVAAAARGKAKQDKTRAKNRARTDQSRACCELKQHSDALLARRKKRHRNAEGTRYPLHRVEIFRPAAHARPYLSRIAAPYR